MIYYADSEHDHARPTLIGYGKRGPIYQVQGGSEPATETPPGDTPPKPPETPPAPPAPPTPPAAPPAASPAANPPSGTDDAPTWAKALPERLVSTLREAVPHLAQPPAPTTPPVVVKRTFGERWFGLPASGDKS